MVNRVDRDNLCLYVTIGGIERVCKLTLGDIYYGEKQFADMNLMESLIACFRGHWSDVDAKDLSHLTPYEAKEIVNKTANLALYGREDGEQKNPPLAGDPNS